MKISTTTGLVGFLLALAALNLPASEAKVNPQTDQSANLTVESRLARISAALREQENQIQDPTLEENLNLMSLGWGNRSGGGSWVNVNRPAWRNGGFINSPWRNGGFINNPWRNGWRDGGSFYNRRW